MKITDCIPVGYRNAISRKQLSVRTGLSDRENRKLIEEEYDPERPVINVGTGYFIPAEGEELYVRIYRMKEASRVKKVGRKLRMLDIYLGNDRQIPGQMELENIMEGD